MKKTWLMVLVLSLAVQGILSAAEGDAELAVAKAAAVSSSAQAQGKNLLDVPEGAKTHVDNNYVLKAGDKVNIKIFPEDQYIRGGQYEITPEGNITLPLLGKIQIMDKTMGQASDTLKEIINKDYIVDPEVVVEMLGYKQETFVILGQVQKPGTFNFPAGVQEFTFLQAISMAGGFSQVANIKKIKIIRQDGGQRKIIRINAENIIGGESPDLEIKAGDVIHVSESLF